MPALSTGYRRGVTDTALVATLLPNQGIADAATRLWDAGEAIAPIPVTAPMAEIEQRLALARPTHLLDEHGRHELRGGVRVPADTAAVITTSGTTGTPKLVELTRSGMDVMGRGYSAAVGAGPRDRWLACMPLHHVASLAIVARAFVCELPFVVYDAFDLDRVANSFATDCATMISLVPTTLTRLLDSGAPLDRFRCLIIGGAVLPPGLRSRAEAAGARVVDAYGLSETWGGCAINGVANDGIDLRLGQDQEIQVRGAPVMRRYRFAPQASQDAVTSDGWLRTGDVGRLDAGPDEISRLQVIDRLKDLVITGGVNVSPTEVEDVVQQHPQVRDVCVIGIPDEEWGERLVAVVVAVDPADPPTIEVLREFARERLSTPKLPRELRLVHEIPRGASGKALRRLLACS